MLIDNFLLVEGGRFRDGPLRELLTDHPYPLPQPGSEHRRPEGASGCQRAWCGGTAPDDRAVRAGGRAGLHGSRAGQCGRRGGARAGPAGGRGLRVPHRHRPDDPREDHHRPRGRGGHGGLHRHVAHGREQLQRAGTGDAGGCSLCFPGHGRGADPDERGLPAAHPDHRARGLHACAHLPGGGGGGQRRNLAACHQRAFRGAWGHVEQRGHDEQPDLRQRRLPVL